VAQTNDNPFPGGEKLRLVKFSRCRNVRFSATCAGQIQKFFRSFYFPGVAEARAALWP
jgi:hypothetical protein